MGVINSRKVSRKAPMKGVKAIAFAPFNAADPILNTPTGVIDLPVGITTPAAISRIEVRATGNNVSDTATFDEATRTNEYVGVNTFFIPGNDIALRNEMQGNAGILLTMFIEDYNGKIFVMGAQNGCDVMTTAFSTDTQGWSLTVNSREIDAMYELAEAGKVEYLASIKPIV